MAWAQSLVGELKSHWPHSQKANEQEEKEQWFKIAFIRTHMPVRERSHFIKMLKAGVFLIFYLVEIFFTMFCWFLLYSNGDQS